MVVKQVHSFIIWALLMSLLEFRLIIEMWRYSLIQIELIANELLMGYWITMIFFLEADVFIYGINTANCCHSADFE